MTAEQKAALRRIEFDFIAECEAGCAYIERAKGGQPPREAQHRFVMQWPEFGCADELERKHCWNAPVVPMTGLLLHGASGTGKTTSAYMAIEASLLRWESQVEGVRHVIAVGAVELGRRISELSRRGGEEFEDCLAELQRTPLLFIDDIDKARFTPRVESELFALIERREVDGLPVVITTNLTGRELQGMFSRQTGPAIISRLRRMCIAVNFDDAEFDAEAALAAVQERMRERYEAHGARWPS
jgi:chromosomal replication initiation ATPase DnaA